MKTVYFLSNYNWCRGELISEGLKNFKIEVPAIGSHLRETKYVPKEKCAMPDDAVCVVWETWKGKNGRGGYRVERELYPEDRLPAKFVHYNHVIRHGRVNETSYGVKRS